MYRLGGEINIAAALVDVDHGARPGTGDARPNGDAANAAEVVHDDGFVEPISAQRFGLCRQEQVGGRESAGRIRCRTAPLRRQVEQLHPITPVGSRRTESKARHNGRCFKMPLHSSKLR